MRRFAALLLIALAVLSCTPPNGQICPREAYPPICSRDARGYTYEARWLPDEYMDGDTISVTVDGWYQRVRVAGVNCPERNKEGGPEATAFTRAFLEAAGGEVTLISEGLCSFGRALCRVVTDQGDLSELLLEAGHAVPYTR